MRMRYVAACAVLASFVAAQSGFAQKVKSSSLAPMIGPVVGLNIFSFTGSDATGTKSLSTITLGGAVSFQLSPSVFFEPQLLYSTKGASADLGGITAKFNIHYVDLPLLLGVRIPTQSGIRPYIVVGPVAGYQVKCDISATSGGTTSSGNCKDNGIDVKNFNFGVTGGAGLEFLAGPMTLQAGARYELGLSEPLTGSNVKNSGIAIAVGAMFSLGRRQ